MIIPHEATETFQNVICDAQKFKYTTHLGVHPQGYKFMGNVHTHLLFSYFNL